MTRLVFVHGMKNEDQNPSDLKALWHDSLRAGWDQIGVSVPENYDLEMPYYGQVLHELTDGADERSGSRRSDTQEIGPNIGEFESEYYRLLQDRLEISDGEVRSQLSDSVVERGPANWEWVQAIARAIEKRSKKIGEFALKHVPQVDGYLDRPTVRKAVDGIIEPTLIKGKTILVAHSLGTVISYLLLKKQSGNLDIPLFVTLGSPLGISTIVRNIRPIALPDRVASWVNGSDERDYVALESKLTPPVFPEMIVNISNIKNDGDDKHAITEYLKNPKISKCIADALLS